MKSEERLTDIEIKLAHLENLVEQLNKVVADQQNELYQLKKTNRQIMDFAESMKSYVIKEQREEAPPPHY